MIYCIIYIFSKYYCPNILMNGYIIKNKEVFNIDRNFEKTLLNIENNIDVIDTFYDENNNLFLFLIDDEFHYFITDIISLIKIDLENNAVEEICNGSIYIKFRCNY